MQRIGPHVLRAVRTCPPQKIPLPHEIVTISNVHRDVRRYIYSTSFRGMANPIKWIRERINPMSRPDLSEKEENAARKHDQEQGRGSLFDDVPKLIEQQEKAAATSSDLPTTKSTEHKYSTANFKISHRKLNLLARQIAGKPIDHAILQMQFSPKRAARRIKSALVVARQHALEYKGLDRSKLIVGESWVTKGPKQIKRIDIKGRGRMGVKRHPDSRLSVILREGKTLEEKAKLLREKKLNRIRSPSLMREDKPLVNVPPIYAW